ncbi:hypothetical protein BU16DRAFT_589536 [Lophium mytilinum]|uniref:Uncharacterized protein n=1 Tax=Lophium mytilinum TaxID=390894 RepID=A0A6A6QQC0_9PEZI|nr:hypothetical protein BU16DRAFT_589536 [Lophium mytilinum]
MADIPDDSTFDDPCTAEDRYFNDPRTTKEIKSVTDPKTQKTYDVLVLKGGTKWQHEKVAAIAVEWHTHGLVNIPFNLDRNSREGTADYDILIAFDPRMGNYSQIGNMSREYAHAGIPSMNLCNISSKTNF